MQLQKKTPNSMNYLEKLTEYISNITSEDQQRVADDLIEFFTSQANIFERQLEFLHYSLNSFRIDAYLKNMDFFGILHLEPRLYSSKEINYALEKRKLVNKIYRTWIKDFEDNKKNE